LLSRDPDTTIRFNLGLRPAMRLRRMSLATNYLVFIRDSQGVSTKKRYIGLAD
jgi:hypothetical protein